MPDWRAEYDALVAADGGADGEALGPEDLERLAVAAHLSGRDDQVTALLDRAHRMYAELGRFEEAGRCCFWAAFHLANRGETAQASGWTGRLRRLAQRGDPVGRLAPLVDQLDAARLMFSRQAAAALPLFEQVLARTPAAADPDSFVLACLGRARCLELLGRQAASAEALDEGMVLVVSGDAAPQVVGLAYCAAIDLCMGWFDIRRAEEWTTALSAWVDGQAGMVPYRGVCLVHRAELSYLRGRWSESSDEAGEACRRLAASGERAAGWAYYRLGEVARARGRVAAAEQAYSSAAEAGAEVQPGLGLLRLAQGRVDAAAAGLDRALAERPGDPQLLAARIEVALSAGDAGAAGELLKRLQPEASGPALVAALATRSTGAVRLADGDAAAALPLLRRAWSLWQEVGAPYEAARTRLLVAEACERLGDRDAAAMERSAARAVLNRLDARPELARLGDATAGQEATDRLSPRERQVLRLVATGASNRAIAERLVLSEKTVARHLSNIFDKIGVATRSAATAYAYDRGLA